MLDSENVVFVMDWSNIDRGQREMGYRIATYSKEVGFTKLNQWLSEIGEVTRKEVYSPLHDIYGHFEFLRDRNFTIILCPVVAFTLEDTTDSKMIKNVVDLIENYNMKYLIIGSGDGHFQSVLEKAKAKGIKVGVVYGSDLSLSRKMYDLVDLFPEGHKKAGKPIIYLFSPTVE